ncbi:MAG: hypothetical protein LBT78_08145 [Tannerella sp.]|jgi:hypothetical protein|nr:hypothetical protein [Tannerella sp.]
MESEALDKECLGGSVCFAKNLINVRAILPGESAILEDILYEAIFRG